MEGMAGGAVGASEGTAGAVETGAVDTGSSEATGGSGVAEAGSSEGGSEVVESHSFDSFDMTDGEEAPEENPSEESDPYKIDVYEGEEVDAETQAEIAGYVSIAKEYGIAPEAFKALANQFILNNNNFLLAEAQASKENESNVLKNLKNELNSSEKQMWKPTVIDLTERFGQGVAKKICMDAEVYRAFIAKQGKGIDVKKAEAPRMSAEQAMEARTAELQRNLGNPQKIQEIKAKWAKDYPELFKA